MTHFDPETGEIYGTNSARAQRAAADGWHQKRMDERGVGYVGLYLALARAYTKISPVIINDGSGHKYRYATLKQLISIVRGPLLEQGIIIRQGTENVMRIDEGGGSKLIIVPVFTDLIFADTGEVVRTKVDIPVIKADPQAMGSAVTYGKRYSLLAVLGLATDDDDDAQAAMPNDAIDKDGASELLASMKKAKDLESLIKWRNDHDRAIKRLNESDFEKVKNAFLKMKEGFEE